VIIFDSYSFLIFSSLRYSSVLQREERVSVFGRFGWLGKIAGAFLGMMLIGNNAGIFRTPDTRSIQRIQTPALPVEEQTNSGGMKR
jgi:hypothetical protein